MMPDLQIGDRVTWSGKSSGVPCLCAGVLVWLVPPDPEVGAQGLAEMDCYATYDPDRALPWMRFRVPRRMRGKLAGLTLATGAAAMSI